MLVLLSNDINIQTRKIIVQKKKSDEENWCKNVNKRIIKKIARKTVL